MLMTDEASWKKKKKNRCGRLARFAFTATYKINASFAIKSYILYFKEIILLIISFPLVLLYFLNKEIQISQ